MMLRLFHFFLVFMLSMFILKTDLEAQYRSDVAEVIRNTAAKDVPKNTAGKIRPGMQPQR